MVKHLLRFLEDQQITQFVQFNNMHKYRILHQTKQREEIMTFRIFLMIFTNKLISGELIAIKKFLLIILKNKILCSISKSQMRLPYLQGIKNKQMIKSNLHRKNNIIHLKNKKTEFIHIILRLLPNKIYKNYNFFSNNLKTKHLNQL